MKHTQSLMSAALIGALAFTTTVAQAADPLPSWNDTAPKKAIVAFVEKVTKQGSSDFVPPAERIAVFDNDGTLWPEDPMPFQAAFVLDELKRRVRPARNRSKTSRSTVSTSIPLTRGRRHCLLRSRCRRG